MVDAEGNVVGMLDEADISRFYLKAGDEQQPKPPAPVDTDPDPSPS